MQIRLVVLLAIVVVACTPITRISGEFRAKQPGWTYRDSILTYQNQPLYRVVQTNLDRYETHYEIKSMNGATIVDVTFTSSHEGTIECRAGFPTLNRHFYTRYRIIPFTDLLASFVDTGVLTLRGVELAGVEAYVAERPSIKLVDTAANDARMRDASRRHDCRSCQQDYVACQVRESELRRNPPRGVSYATSCDAQFQTCSHACAIDKPKDNPSHIPGNDSTDD